MFNIVLLEPEIPANTGNIGRTCVACGLRLHLIEPLGFIINDKNLKRAGMDYWKDLDWHLYNDYEDFLAKNPDSIGRTYYATTKAHKTYADADYKPGDYIMFGKESAGIPEEILVRNEEACIRIPMKEEYRSLNLSNSVAVIAYEAMRQNDFKSLEEYGKLHRLKWQ
ncbi:tRNA (cytidine(34)-2'-O)-methyltransferase [Howardella ureilytica]|nr:tRNA (cytidine(34)-2'-O)-methyltransferase [Lachnospiraceae bacterium]MDY2956600.1 tRNA (cytidine(34)-2'-O)-methyltransferase [Lachnospiraceae bacterium]